MGEGRGRLVGRSAGRQMDGGGGSRVDCIVVFTSVIAIMGFKIHYVIAIGSKERNFSLHTLLPLCFSRSLCHPHLPSWSFTQQQQRQWQMNTIFQFDSFLEACLLYCFPWLTGAGIKAQGISICTACRIGFSWAIPEFSKDLPTRGKSMQIKWANYNMG